MEAVRDRLLSNFSAVCARELDTFQGLENLPAKLWEIIFPS
jgi:flagellar basal body-associated protein FliL